MQAEKAELDAKAKVLAKDHAAFALLENRSREALKSLYEKGLEKPLATNEDDPTHLLPYLVEALEEVVRGIDPMVEAEARVLSSAALTRVFSHLHLHDPAARLDELLEPVADETPRSRRSSRERSGGSPAEEVRRLRPRALDR